YKYVYQFKDHLGNIRLSYSDRDNDGVVDILRNNTDIDGDGDYQNEIREEKAYYPFGMTHQKEEPSLISGNVHPYGFNGKEEQKELGLEWLDFGARNYDAALGRWMNIDPLAESMRRHSPYNYAFDNPVYYMDPDGMVAMAFDWINNGDGTYTAEAGDSAATLAEDAGISLEEADQIVQSQLGKNYEGEDGEMKSDVEIGDIVAVPEQVEAFENERAAAAENEIAVEGLQDEIVTNESSIAKNNKDADSLTKVANREQEKYDLSLEMGLHKPAFPDEPSGGIAIGTTIVQARREAKIKKTRKQISKLNRTTDSLKKENQKKKKEINKRGYFNNSSTIKN
ncbi:RHS repeat-associated core domain-containing protein, partial [Aquimarina sp. U1-2]|uniref:RHS repeat domain-containing protein n=1 Tax=Aquimarina sp. U1-2 TaxID=2823141 RepID=UPI001AECB891